MIKNKFILLTFLFFVFFNFPSLSFAQDKVESSASSGFSKVVDVVDNFRKKMSDRFNAQKEIFEAKGNTGELSQDLEGEEPTTNYVIKGSSDKLIEPIYKILAFIFYGLGLIFAKAVLFYVVIFFFLFILLRYLWRRAV